ncbi:tRNA pseudouridine synthase A 1 [Parachlamydia acanthamoebae UV-7]|uniref:tRNA pseudouridine synthase A n=1 Tax=Parachlamydia acanthamoebae (strain UV7) TaxID=765952 RepID=F8KVL2_PARAV|nr:tRNA pseudouridine(38-40) synthase TruA [Parachlamydia acanthamoebae]CCB85148.1 tRNA pseudouridine synthase A 1 [Parachlamydia acanthamoebae UV-7]
MSYKFKITLAYDGTHYSGWQIQPNALAIQEIVEKEIGKIVRQPVRVVASGRTDAGVHARGQVAHFSTDAEIDLRRFLVSINGLLPKDIRVKDICQVPPDFHAQYSVSGKAYHYHLTLSRVQSPFSRFYAWHIRQKLDLSQLQAAAQLFVGTHDFTSFANEAHREHPQNAVRTIKRVDVIMEDEGCRLEFEGDGFLYKMVRNMVGILIEVATGYRPITDIPAIFAAKDRKKAGKAAPPHGLFLHQVNFPEGVLSFPH